MDEDVHRTVDVNHETNHAADGETDWIATGSPGHPEMPEDRYPSERYDSADYCDCYSHCMSLLRLLEFWKFSLDIGVSTAIFLHVLLLNLFS